ncbi:MAG TPA: aminopeptidase P N-terminal domain-containing protein, partial [Terriglobia bacterium]|nr:aminopeptidase P N-terminal domain-containing protein [Terriglobia bacterium]
MAQTVDGPIVIFGYTGHEDASEVAVFFQEPNFYYLTGHDEPGAALVILPRPPKPGIVDYVTPAAILYLPARDPAQEIWEGPKIGPNDPGVAEKTGFQTVEPLDKLKGDLANLAKTYKTF